MAKNQYDALSRAVDAFAARMKQKLHAQAHRGWSGWNAAHYRKHLANNMVVAAARLYAGDQGQDLQQAVDVANYAMFLDHLDAEAAAKQRKDKPK